MLKIQHDKYKKMLAMYPKFINKKQEDQMDKSLKNIDIK